MIQVARQNNHGENVHFTNVSIDEFESEEQFDLIICTHAFPYFPNKSEAIQKMASLCRDNGKIIIVSSSTNNFKDLLANLLVKTRTSKARYLSIPQMKRLFTSAGFEVKSVSQAEAEFGDFVIALCFASPLPQVIESIKKLSEKHRVIMPSVPVFGNNIFCVKRA